MENPQLVLGGLTSPGQGALSSPLAVLQAKKMVARYCLLAWTMCFTTFSRPLATNLGTTGGLLEKKLLREEELASLQVSLESPRLIMLYLTSLQ